MVRLRRKDTHLSFASESHYFAESKSINFVVDCDQYDFYEEWLTVLYIGLKRSSRFWTVDIDLENE